MSDLDPRLAPILQLKQLMTGNDLDLNPIISAFAQQIQQQAAQGIAQAVGDLKSMDVDPDKYISVPRSYYRNEMEKQKLRHADELHAIEVARLNAGTARLQQIATSTP